METAASSPGKNADTMPRGALWTLGALVLVALAGTAAVRLSGVEIREPDSAAVTVRRLQFADAADRSVHVLDAASGQQIARLEGEQGFLRGTLRAMARERRARGVAADEPLELVARADGRLTLQDPATGQRIDLESFGPSNVGVFAPLVRAQPNRSQP